MKKYTFRLEAVLKLRKLKEENCRMELGQLFKGLNKIDDQINHDKIAITNYSNLQEASLKDGIKAGQLQLYPSMIEAKDKNIELLFEDKRVQQLKIEDKMKELASLRGDLKVMENMKDKNYEEYRKAVNKEIDMKVEEQTQNWLQTKNK